MLDILALKYAAYSILLCILLSYIIWSFLQGHLEDDPAPAPAPGTTSAATPTTASTGASTPTSTPGATSAATPTIASSDTSTPTPAPGATSAATPTAASADTSTTTPAPISVNYHFTRKCNKTCIFCFHTDKTSHVASEEDMQRGLRLLKEAGMKKINFAGGEPFLYPKQLAMLCKFCKEDLKLESVSIISNGTKITQNWLQKYGKYVDVLGVSCDSFDEKTNIEIGRGDGNLVPQLFKIRQWCRELKIMFKLNTVVLTWNWEEDMAKTVTELAPDRWKVFQVLSVEGENDSAEAETELDKRKRNVKNVLITDEQFKAYCDRHKDVPNFVPESNDLMASSYIILDEYLRFLDKGNGPETHSSSILEVGVDKALAEVHFDRNAFKERGGIYNWSKEEVGCTTRLPSALEF